MKGWNIQIQTKLMLGGCALVLAICAASQAKVTMLQAPEVAEAAAFKSMSVARFPGQYGDSLSTAIESTMMNARVQDKPVYRSVSRAPEGRSLGGNSQALASTARSQGTDAMLVGEVTRAGVRDEHSTSERYVCDQTKNPINPQTGAGYIFALHQPENGR